MGLLAPVKRRQGCMQTRVRDYSACVRLVDASIPFLMFCVTHPTGLMPTHPACYIPPRLHLPIVVLKNITLAPT